MGHCNGYKLSAYLDAELSPAARGRVEAHLSTCARCAVEFRGLRDAQHLLGTLGVRNLTPLEWARAHRVIEDEVLKTRRDRARGIAWTLGTIAASILVIATAWLNELPATAGTRAQRPTPALAEAGPPTWEQVALTLQVEPPSMGFDLDGSTRLADARFAGWMLESLGPQVSLNSANSPYRGDSDAK